MKTKNPPAMKGARQQPSPTNASTPRILSALGGTSSAVSAISVTNLDALPAGAGDFKVSGSVGKAPGDTLRVAAAGSGSADVNTKSAAELGGNNLGRVKGDDRDRGPCARHGRTAEHPRRGSPRPERDSEGGERSLVPGARLLRAPTRERSFAGRQDLVRMGS